MHLDLELYRSNKVDIDEMSLIISHSLSEGRDEEISNRDTELHLERRLVRCGIHER